MSQRVLSVIALIYWLNIVKLGFISPEEIIVYPNSCVNITLSDEICDQILEVSLYVYEKLFTRDIWLKNYPTDTLYYYYSRYLNNIGANWVSLCDLDHNFADREIKFKVIKKNNIKYYVSSKIKIAHCGYVSGCQNIIFPHNNDILNHVTQISDFNQDIKLKLNFPNSKFMSFLRFSLCHRIENCQHVSIISNYQTKTNDFDGLSVHLDIPSKLMTLLVSSYKLSQMTFHILYTEKNINSLLTTTFNYTNRMLEPKLFPYSVQYNVKSLAKVVGYNIYFSDSTKIGFTSFEFEDINELRMILISNIKCEINKISWSFFGNITYNIIFIDFEIDHNGEYISEIHHLIIDDYPIDFIQKNKTIQSTSSDSQSFKKSNLSKINIILLLNACTIFLLVLLVLKQYKKTVIKIK